jgi:hypothetical protein
MINNMQELKELTDIFFANAMGIIWTPTNELRV